MTENTIISSGRFMEEKIETLSKIKVDVENWEIYYLDERTGEKWLKEFPFSKLHGGGQPQLRLLIKFPWEQI